jgi:NADH-quinone oxidoreductase subunit H
MDLTFLVTSLVKIIGLTFMVILPMVAYSVMAERRLSAIQQDRVGPNRTNIPTTLLGFKTDWTIFGMGGLLQPMADGLKFILKEDYTPGHVRKFYFWLAPALTMVPALLTCAVMPFGSELDLGPTWQWATGLAPAIGELGINLTTPVKAVIADLSIGPLFTFAIASLGVYGIVLAGWSSNSKYPFLGGVRSSSQMISYELSLGLSILPVLMTFGHLNLGEIAAAQDREGWLILPLWGEKGITWGEGGITPGRLALWIPMFISFLIFVVAMFAETNRLPFDLPECETELVAGYHTEYSSMKFALFFLGEYAAMIIGSGLAVTLFLGGWSIPFAPALSQLTGLQFHYVPGHTPIWLGLAHIATFFAKVIGFILFFIAVRWTLPRFRYDQLMRLGWLWMFEIALLNVIICALIMMWLPLP